MLRSVRLASCARYASAILCVAAALMAGAGQAQQQKAPSKLPLPKAEPAPKRIVTQGLGKVTIEDLVPCAVNQPGMNIRKNPVGEIVAKDGTADGAGAQQFPDRAEASRSLQRVQQGHAGKPRGSRPEQAADRRGRQGRRGRHRLHGRRQLLRALHQRQADRRRRHAVHAVQLARGPLSREAALHHRRAGAGLGRQAGPRHGGVRRK